MLWTAKPRHVRVEKEQQQENAGRRNVPPINLHPHLIWKLNHRDSLHQEEEIRIIRLSSSPVPVHSIHMVPIDFANNHHHLYLTICCCFCVIAIKAIPGDVFNIPISNRPQPFQGSRFLLNPITFQLIRRKRKGRMGEFTQSLIMLVNLSTNKLSLGACQ